MPRFSTFPRLLSLLWLVTPFLSLAQQTELSKTPLAGHLEPVKSVAYSPDGRQIVSGSSDNTLKIWVVSSGKLLKTLTGHSGTVITVSYCPDGRQIVSGSGDHTLKIWEARTGRLLKTLNNHTRSILAVSFSPGGQQIVSASADSTLKVWDMSNGTLLKTLSGHTSYVDAVSFSPDGRQIVSVSWDNTLKIWNVSTGQVLKSVTIDPHPVKLAFMPNSPYLFVVTAVNTIEVRNAQTLELIKSYDNLGFFTDADFKAPLTPDGQYEIYPYWQSFFLKKAQPTTLMVTVQPPVVQWETPANSQGNVAQERYTTKACVQGQEVTLCQLFLNGQLVGKRTIKTVLGSCAWAVEEVISLKSGQNELYILATNAGGTTRSETRYLTYQPPAAPSSPSVPVAMPTTSSTPVAPAQKRLALVIGNARYAHAGTLANPINDAEAVRQVFIECGFEVIYKTNLDKKGMVTAFQEFGDRLRQYNVGLAYYAGHGLSVKGVNYFMPTDANPQSEDEVEFESIPAARLIRKMEEVNHLSNIMLFDACRNNPFARSWGRTLGDQGGFALLPPPKGSIIAYAASDGEQAA